MNTLSALNTAAAGLFQSQDNFNQAATSLINSFTPVLAASSGDVTAQQNFSQLPATGQNLQNQTVQNPFAGNTLSASTLLASNILPLFDQQQDPATAMVNLLQSEYALQANAKAYSSIDQTQQDLLNTLV